MKKWKPARAGFDDGMMAMMMANSMAMMMANSMMAAAATIDEIEGDDGMNLLLMSN